MENYYKQRAPIYDQVYLYPERENDINFLKAQLPSKFSGLDVIEVAAGTGYWTQFICRTAKSILATDAVQEPLNDLKRRALPKSVTIAKADAYALREIKPKFNGAFAGLWLSHVPKQKIHSFITGLHLLLESGSKVIFIDNAKTQCERLPITREDDLGNTYQQRELEGGSSYEVLKNFPAEAELKSYVADFANNINFIELEHFWLLEYKAK